MSSARGIRAGAACIELYANDNRLVRGLNRAQKRLKAFGSSVQRIGAHLTGIGIGLATGFAISSRVFAGFDDRMRQVRAVMGATEAQFQSLRAEAKRLGRTTSFTAGQVAEAMTELGRAGFKPEAILSSTEAVLATSTDGINWTRVSNNPVYRLAASGPDNGAMTSPAVVQWNGMFYMIYLGWQLDSQCGFVDFRIRGATSPDGINWARRTQPVFGPPSDELPWLDSAIEPTLMQASDGLFYLFITADDEEITASPTSIAVLRSCHPFGPWEACPDPVLTMTQPWEDNEIVAPHVMEDEGKLRMWYHGLTFNDPATGERFRIGYAEMNFDADPLRFDLTGDGRVDLDDLYEQHQNPVDLDLDGLISRADKDALEAHLRRFEREDMAAGRRYFADRRSQIREDIGRDCPNIKPRRGLQSRSWPLLFYPHRRTSSGQYRSCDNRPDYPFDCLPNKTAPGYIITKMIQCA